MCIKSLKVNEYGTPCFVRRIFADISMFWSKLSKILLKLDHLQIVVSRQQIKVKRH